MTDEESIVSPSRFGSTGAWREVPESTALIIQHGPDEQREFHPLPPS